VPLVTSRLANRLPGTIAIDSPGEWLMTHVHDDLPGGGMSAHSGQAAEPAPPENGLSMAHGESASSLQHETERPSGADLAVERARRRELEGDLALHDAALHRFVHDLRNPLTGLSLNAQLALRHIARADQIDPRRVERSLQAILGQAADIAALLDRLMDGSLRREMGQRHAGSGAEDNHHASSDGRNAPETRQ
jgi:signal transduction histidine kinase